LNRKTSLIVAVVSPAKVDLTARDSVAVNPEGRQVQFLLNSASAGKLIPAVRLSR